MDRMDKIISDVAYVLDSLRCLRDIDKLGNCNDCDIKVTCKYVPKPGQMVRYNCPFYEKEVTK